MTTGIESVDSSQQARPGSQLRYRCVLFDFSGTLAHVSPSTELFFARFLADYGVPIDLEMLRAVLARHFVAPEGPAPYASARELDRYWLRLYRSVLSAFGVPEHHAALVAREMLAAHEAADSYELYPDTRATLMALRAAGAEIGVVSNFGPSLGRKLKHLGIVDLLHHVTCSVDVGLAKPSGAFFEHVLERYALDRNDVLYVGDDPLHDLEPCQQLGVRCVLVARQVVTRPLVEVGSLADVVDLVVGRSR